MMDFLGPFSFGVVIGWVAYRTLRRKVEGVALGDLAAVIGAIGSATVIALFKEDAFNSYAVGLAVGFFAYFAIGGFLGRKKEGRDVTSWMSTRDEQ